MESDNKSLHLWQISGGKAGGEKAKTETCHWLLEQNQIYISFAFNRRRFVMFFQVVTSLRVLVRFEVM